MPLSLFVSDTFGALGNCLGMGMGWGYPYSWPGGHQKFVSPWPLGNGPGHENLAPVFNPFRWQ